MAKKSSEKTRRKTREDHARQEPDRVQQERRAIVVQGMGLRRIRHSVELKDTPATRGMIHKVRHLVEVRSNHGSLNQNLKTSTWI
jgi:ribosomal protein L30